MHISTEVISVDLSLHVTEWQPTPVLLPGKSHGQRSVVRCSPWGCKESDMTKQLHFCFQTYLQEVTLLSGQ